MKYLALVLIAACGAPTAPLTRPASLPDDPGEAAQPPSTQPGAGLPDAGPAPMFDHWVFESSALGRLQSPAPGDIWAGQYRRVGGQWVLTAPVPANDMIWVASSTEVWALDSPTSRLHRWTPSGQTVTDLSRPNRRYTVLRDGWLAYVDDVGTGFIQINHGSFTDVRAPAARFQVTDVWRNVAVTFAGEILSWNGTEWTLRVPVSGTPDYRSTGYDNLGGTSDQDLYMLGGFRGMSSLHFNAGSFSNFMPGGFRATSLWVRPEGAWAISWPGNLFELVDGNWVDRGPVPLTTGSIGSDGTDLFAATQYGIYRFVR